MDERKLKYPGSLHNHLDWSNERLRDCIIKTEDLIDYAIYRIEASKKRYMYLLKQAKEKKLTFGFSREENLSLFSILHLETSRVLTKE